MLIAQVWTSDLKRAWQTANFILHHHMTNNDEEVMECEEFLVQKPLSTIFTDARLRERVRLHMYSKNNI